MSKGAFVCVKCREAVANKYDQWEVRVEIISHDHKRRMRNGVISIIPSLCTKHAEEERDKYHQIADVDQGSLFEA